MINSKKYFNSIFSIKIKKNKINYSKNLQNNKKLETFFDDYRFKRVEQKNLKRNQNL